MTSTGRRLAAFAQTGLAAVAVWLVGIALAAVGYTGTEVPSEAAQAVIRALMSVGSSAWLIPGVICCIVYPLTTARHAQVQRYLKSGEGDREQLIEGM